MGLQFFSAGDVALHNFTVFRIVYMANIGEKYNNTITKIGNVNKYKTTAKYARAHSHTHAIIHAPLYTL